MARPITRSVTNAQKQQQQQHIKKKVTVVRNYNLRLRSQRRISSRPQPTTGTTNHVNSLPPEILWKVFGEFDLIEKIKLRAVCHMWNCVVESFLASRTRYVRLNLRKLGTDTDGSNWNPALSYRAIQFEGVWDEPTDLHPDQKVSLTLPSVSVKIANSFDRIFSLVHTLVIYFDLQDTPNRINHLIRLLSRSFTNLSSFSLIMSTEITSDRTLPLIGKTIYEKLDNLRRLNLFVSDYKTEIQFGLHPYNVQLTKTISILEHMALSCTPLNFIPIMKEIGKSHEHFREWTLTNRELASLSIQCRMDGSDIEQMFATNSELTRVSRLQLTCVNGPESNHLPMVDKFLSESINVQNLQLFFSKPSCAKFNKLWFEILAKMPKLTELTLGEFVLGNDIPQTEDYRLPNVKKLTLATCDLLTRYKRNSPERVLDIEDFTDTIAYMFPSLEEIVIRAGEGQTFQMPLDMLKEDMGSLLFFKLEHTQSVQIDFQDPTCLHIRSKIIIPLIVIDD